MSFINYRPLCSYYILIQNVAKPQILFDLLNLVYDAMNYNIFQMLNINININTTLDNVLDDYISSYSITSDFIAMHYEDFINLFTACLILFILRVLKSKSNRQYNINNMLNLYFKQLFLAQLTSILSVFMFPFGVICTYMNWQRFIQKLNVLSHLLCIILFMMIPFVGMLILKIQKNSKKYNMYSIRTVDQKSIQQLSSTKKQINISIKQTKYVKQQSDYQLFYCGICSFFMPLVIIVNIQPIIFVFGFIIYSYGINQARKQKVFRINKILLESHILIFHISFCAVTLIVGAIRQTLNMIFKIFRKIYQIIKTYFFTNKVINQNNVNKKSKKKLNSNNQPNNELNNKSKKKTYLKIFLKETSQKINKIHQNIQNLKIQQYKLCMQHEINERTELKSYYLNKRIKKENQRSQVNLKILWAIDNKWYTKNTLNKMNYIKKYFIERVQKDQQKQTEQQKPVRQIKSSKQIKKPTMRVRSKWLIQNN